MCGTIAAEIQALPLTSFFYSGNTGGHDGLGSSCETLPPTPKPTKLPIPSPSKIPVPAPSKEPSPLPTPVPTHSPTVKCFSVLSTGVLSLGTSETLPKVRPLYL
jgi:hypothetical protein